MSGAPELRPAYRLLRRGMIAMTAAILINLGLLVYDLAIGSTGRTLLGVLRLALLVAALVSFRACARALSWMAERALIYKTVIDRDLPQLQAKVADAVGSTARSTVSGSATEAGESPPPSATTTAESAEERLVDHEI
jgi:Zn-dependent membrane protease YugP